MNRLFVCMMVFMAVLTAGAAPKTTKKDYVPAPYTWTTQSKNSSESMPCGGHDIGMNVWVEDGDVMVYLTQSGAFDENNTLLKAGRVRIHFDDNDNDDDNGKSTEGCHPLIDGGDFSQTLSLDEGCIYIKGGGIQIRLWADVYEPVVFADITSQRPCKATLSYESWRHHDRVVPKEACQQFSWKWLNKGDKVTFADTIRAEKSSITFEHRNRQETIYDYTVSYEKLDAVKQDIPNPIGGLVSGGRMQCPGFTFSGTTDGTYASTDYRAWNFINPALKHSTVSIELRNAKGNITFNPQPSTFNTSAFNLLPSSARVELAEQPSTSASRSSKWWHAYWQRSYIKSTHPEAQKIARNYELFRYMLGCNAYGEWPTKFNGGLFCFDPVYVQQDNPFTPDFRCWGGGTMTAQNQRLVYWPMLKSGDVDMMASQFDTYLRMLPAAMARTRHYWGHGGACFEEQIENFGLPNPAEYGKHKEGEDPGWQRNAWLEYLWDTSLEFCQMILDANRYTGMDIEKYRPLIAECIRFFDEHYQQLAKQRGSKALDEQGRLVLYPGSGCETYKMTYNASSTVAGLQYIIAQINEHHGGLQAFGLDSTLVQRIPEIPMRYLHAMGKPDGRLEQCIAPAESWMRIQNVESPQMYPIFPWRIYGLGRPEIDIARNTYYNDDYVQKMRSSTGWKQDNIWAPLLGIKDDAKRLCMEKFADGPYRFPAFWERGFDWAPDHNRGGSAMIGLQEMLLQEKPDGELMLFPCWPKEWDAEFRLAATGGRTVNAQIKGGKVYNGVSEGGEISAVVTREGKVVETIKPLRVAIFGDSYSTFEGYIPDSHEPWYYLPDSPGKTKDNDVMRADQTWWHQLLERMGAQLEINNSWSGSPVAYTGYIERPGEGHADYKVRSFITRLPHLGTPDLILCCAGTNDSWNGEEIGEYKFYDDNDDDKGGTWTEQELYTFRPAMARLCHDVKEQYPNSRFVFIINSELKADFVESMHTILDHYGLEYIDLHDIDKQVGHPSCKGMKAIADQVYDYLHRR